MTEEEAAELAADERRQIAAAEAALREALKSDDYKLIRERLEQLNQATHRLAELIMNSALQTATKGKRADEVNL